MPASEWPRRMRSCWSSMLRGPGRPTTPRCWPTFPRLWSCIISRDLLSAVVPTDDWASRPAGILTSAVTGEGLERLLALLADRLVPAPPPPGAAVPFTRSQFLDIEAALDSICRGDVAGAAGVLATLGRGGLP